MHPLVIMLLILGFGLAFIPGKVLSDSDTGWHIMAGKYISTHSEIPATNIYSHTASSYEWFNISWLYDYILAGIYDLGGLYATVIFTIILLNLALYITAKSCFARGAGVLATAEIFLINLMMVMNYTLVRPHVLSAVFLALSMAAMYSYQRSKKPLILLSLPPLFILWANTHGWFMAGFTIIAAFAAEALLKKQWRPFILLSLCGFSCLAATLLNPLGIHVYTAIEKTMGGPLTAYLSEWKTTTEAPRLIYPVVLVLVMIFAFRKLSVAELLLCTFWLVCGIISVRNLYILFFISAPAVAYGVHAIMMRYKRPQQQEEAYQSLMSRPRLRKYMTAVLVLVTVMVCSPHWPQITGQGESKINNYPKTEAQYILSNYPTRTFFNSYDIGGYLLLATNGKIKTFIDGRAETAFPPQLVSSYIKFIEAKDGWTGILPEYGADAAIISRKYPKQHQAMQALNGWKLVHTGPVALVYIKE